MLRIPSILFGCLLVFLLTSCSDGNNGASGTSADNQAKDSIAKGSDAPNESQTSPAQNPDELLIGSWLVVNVVGEHKDLNMGLIYTWTKEGVMSMEREFYVEGTYTVNKGVIVWTTKDFEFTYDFTISGELMTLIPRDSGHTYTLKRR